MLVNFVFVCCSDDEFYLHIKQFYFVSKDIKVALHRPHALLYKVEFTCFKKLSKPFQNMLGFESNCAEECDHLMFSDTSNIFKNEFNTLPDFKLENIVFFSYRNRY